MMEALSFSNPTLLVMLGLAGVAVLLMLSRRKRSRSPVREAVVATAKSAAGPALVQLLAKAIERFPPQWLIDWLVARKHGPQGDPNAPRSRSPGSPANATED